MRPSNDGPGQPTEFTVAIYRISEFHRTIRVAILSVCGLVGLGLILLAMVEMETSRPPWLILCLAIAAAVTPHSLLVLRWIMKFRHYMEVDHQRVIEMEKLVDSERETSGLNKEGTSPYDV